MFFFHLIICINYNKTDQQNKTQIVFQHILTRIDNYDVWKTFKSAALNIFNLNKHLFCVKNWKILNIFNFFNDNFKNS